MWECRSNAGGTRSHDTTPIFLSSASSTVMTVSMHELPSCVPADFTTPTLLLPWIT
jgi:hypothetical protein